MPTPSFSKDITSIFNSNDLKDELKYDITCRLICEALEVVTVSMLIYDARIDRLTSRGNYIAPKIRSGYEIEGLPVIGKIIENIAILEYFDSEIADLRNASIESFHSSIINGGPKRQVNISQSELEHFNRLKWEWINTDLKKNYREYKSKIHNETHAIDPSTISGGYFSKLLSFGKKLTSEFERKHIIEGPQKGELFFKIWDTVKIRLLPSDLYYIGLPLFATERYTGIIRITAYTKLESTITSIFSLTDSAEKDEQIERLGNFAQLVSLHLKTNYYLDGFRVLSNLEIDHNNNLNIEKEELDDVCNTLTTVIRCNGCIIRLSNDPSVIHNPPIRGISDSLKDYYSYIKQNPGLSFSEDIYKLLKKKGKYEEDIKAINFSIPEDSDKDNFITQEYFYDEDNRLNFNEHPAREFRDFTPAYIRILRNFKMRELVVLKLEFLDSGFLVLTNTINRKFTSSDIEMVLLASKRIGLEIKHNQDTERIKEQNKIIAQEEHGRLIVHQIGTPVRALSGLAQNLDDKIYKEHEVPVKIAQLNRMAYSLLRQINSLQKYIDWEIQPITPKNDTQYHLQSYIRSRAIQFEGLTVGTNLRIWTIIDNENDFYDYCILDKSLLDEIINVLLDNAVKYSFTRQEMLHKVLFFNPSDPFSEGHIHIRVNSTPKQLSLTVENYGSIIEQKEFEKIFDRGIRGTHGKRKSPTGSGIGLYVARKVTKALRGSIEVFHDRIKSKTSFKVSIPL